VVGRDDDDESIAAGSEISDAASWETVNDDEMEVLEESREVCFFFTWTVILTNFQLVSF